MSDVKALVFAGFILFYFTSCPAQNKLTADTSYANGLFTKAVEYDKISKHDSAIILLQQAAKLYLNYFNYQGLSHKWAAGKYLIVLNDLAIQYLSTQNFEKSLSISDSIITESRNVFGDSNEYEALAYHNISNVMNYTGEYDKAISANLKALAMRIHLYGEKHLDVAYTYYSLGASYYGKASYDSARLYFFKTLDLAKKLYGDSCLLAINTYVELGRVYSDNAEYDLALDYYQKALNLNIKLYGGKYNAVHQIYNNIGMIYYYKSEFDLSIEYFLKSLEIVKEIGLEKSSDISAIYNNLGEIYSAKNQMQTALEYITKAAELDRELFGEKNQNVAIDYNNIGQIYHDKNEPIPAFQYFRKSLGIRQALFGENHTDVAVSYYNIGLTYELENKNDSALIYFYKANSIYRKLLGAKHPNIALCYKDIGKVMFDENKFDSALLFFHKGIVADMRDFNDSIQPLSNPIIDKYIESNTLGDLLDAKGETLFRMGNYKAALTNYQLADTLITKRRRAAITKADKIAIGDFASIIYELAINTCLELSKSSKDEKTSTEFSELAFYYSEKNKTNVLLEALAGEQGLKFSGIPDSLLKQERKLKLEINSAEKQLAQDQDSLSEYKDQTLLFALNSDYDGLIAGFEKNYPEYHNLKYGSKYPSLKDIQGMLDKKTAMLSYFVGDSQTYIFNISKEKMIVHSLPPYTGLEDTILAFRNSLTLVSREMKENYRRIASGLFRYLIPDDIDKGIRNLLIIPDGSLGIVPFECLITQDIQTGNNFYKDYPFLIKNYNISYSYSANLYYRTFSKSKNPNIEFTRLDDWIAMAPVFSGEDEKSITLATRELEKDISKQKSKHLSARRAMINGGYIASLPGTEAEVTSIFKEFEDRHLKAEIRLHKSASEQFIKSGKLEKFRYIHFATHGFVNSEKPEISGILLAQDTSGGENGILYSADIYNLKLQAELVVLSACETGLGQIKKGEGLIGLTRALLYAGAKNIIVSLWQVSDQSTSELMVEFYKNLLKGKKDISFSECLRNAKLKLINEEKYSHPFFWSPFILIGK